MKALIEIRYSEKKGSMGASSVIALFGHSAFEGEDLDTDPITMLKATSCGLMNIIRNMEADGRRKKGEVMKAVIKNLNEMYIDPKIETQVHKTGEKSISRTEPIFYKEIQDNLLDSANEIINPTDNDNLTGFVPDLDSNLEFLKKEMVKYLEIDKAETETLIQWIIESPPEIWKILKHVKFKSRNG